MEKWLTGKQPNLGIVVTIQDFPSPSMYKILYPFGKQVTSMVLSSHAMHNNIVGDHHRYCVSPSSPTNTFRISREIKENLPADKKRREKGLSWGRPHKCIVFTLFIYYWRPRGRSLQSTNSVVWTGTTEELSLSPQKLCLSIQKLCLSTQTYL